MLHHTRITHVASTLATKHTNITNKKTDIPYLFQFFYFCEKKYNLLHKKYRHTDSRKKSNQKIKPTFFGNEYLHLVTKNCYEHLNPYGIDDKSEKKTRLSALSEYFLT